MTNTYILTKALEALHALQVFPVRVYIALLHALHAFQVLHMLVYIDVLELFVYINLHLLRCSRFSMYSRRLFKSTLYHVFMQFSRRSSRSIATPIDSA